MLLYLVGAWRSLWQDWFYTICQLGKTLLFWRLQQTESPQKLIALVLRGDHELNEIKAENLSDIARRVPGLTVVQQGNRSSNITTARCRILSS